MGRSSANVSPQFPRSRRSACRDCKYETIPDITQIPEECYVFPLCAFAGRPVGFCSESLQPRAESGRSYQARRGPNVRTLLGPDILGPAFVDIESFPQVLLSFYWFAAQLCRSKKLKMTSSQVAKKGVLPMYLRIKRRRSSIMRPVFHRVFEFATIEGRLDEPKELAPYRKKRHPLAGCLSRPTERGFNVSPFPAQFARLPKS